MRFTDHEKRKKQVLLAVIKNYTQRAEPIGSQLLCHDFDCSSATIRNILAELEEVGFLTHPHTSAGRIPTDQGYRFYIDNLIEETSLLDEEKNYIFKEYRKNYKEIKKIEDTLENASELISHLTHQAGIVSFNNSQDKLIFNGMSFILEQPEFRNL
ncbi:MAG: HrcA family transcriptional regulator, partial [Candidatus Omnitrophota bacterium]